MVNVIEGGVGVFFLIVEKHICCFHDVNGDSPFITLGLKIDDC